MFSVQFIVCSVNTVFCAVCRALSLGEYRVIGRVNTPHPILHPTVLECAVSAVDCAVGFVGFSVCSVKCVVGSVQC